ncbi:heme o synthase [Pseudonocardia benzenivorans]|uniref:Protoheme IX farnesyltransferase n=1 Tax=Pseudonocardia dioxanivorans (strain ATCC 55486 / DSM 44775 / JCM 13855 / CB1190) TaxID=675635 RepID=F4CYF4_PSEUX|nr:Protoheme IX farnesyltransferase [Pseudonocardia dioxanivorans CB1190]GJF04895.1 protoheme IX farnesyltransferase [Pseudonocardia sp. D17]
MSAPATPADPASTPTAGVRRGRGTTRVQRAREVVDSYLALTKTRIIEQLLVVTVPAMFLAQRGVPSVWLILATLVGGAMAAASAHALNCVVDADIDAKMKRTSRRPLAKGVVPPRNALIFGLVLGAVSSAWLALTTNWLAAALSAAAIAFYVLVYTLLLKRRTAQNIVWGGAAGCMPVVIGWAAVTGTVGWPALVMFGVIFFWTPPHFWALAMRYRDDYAAAGVPMLPVVARPDQVSVRIVGYAVVMALWTLLLLPVTSWIYAAVAVLGGGWFVFKSVRMHVAVKAGRDVTPMKLFHLSNIYLCVLFAAIAVDAAVGLPTFGWPF